jgi:hypothetical protein
VAKPCTPAIRRSGFRCGSAGRPFLATRLDISSLQRKIKQGIQNFMVFKNLDKRFLLLLAKNWKERGALAVLLL